MTYKIECNKCDFVYTGETARTGHYRGKQHLDLLRNKHKDSVLYKHLKEKHNIQNNIKIDYFKMSITARHKTALERQISEAIQIDAVPLNKRMNTKEEWGHSRLLTSIIMT